MAKPTIVSMPGDGIGKTVLPEALRVLEAAGFQADYVPAEIGWDCWRTQGNALPQKTIELLEKHRVGLFGAITSKPREAAEKELDPKLQGRGLVYFSPIVGLRQHFNLDICIRPCRSFPGNPLNFVRRSADGSVEEPKVDVVVFRQNTEDLYCGVEWTDPPEAVRQALETHKKMAAFKNVPSRDLAVSCRILSRPATRRIIAEAFKYAAERGYRSVTVCEKPNVIRETSGMMWSEARAIQKEYPNIQLWDTNIDAQMMWLTKNPEDYGVVVSSNMFGDIVSDGFAGLVGGLGFAASANLGETVAVFEPTHGSAPKYADYPVSIVNPIAAILSGCLLLEHLGEKKLAAKIAAAVARVVKEGRVRTYDMLRLKGSPAVLEQGAASTSQMGDAVIQALKKA
jgi:3-isopropylmalate dehydrogenase